MKCLTLIRHAKSSWHDRTLRDFDRPLNARGLRNAPDMARRLAAELRLPLRLISSPALRALSTARYFAAAFGMPEDAIVLEPEIYEASAGTLLALVNALPDTDAHVLLFGHNPGFSDLAHQLADCPFSDMPTCAAVTIAFDLPHWRDVVPGSGRVLHYRYPKES